MQITMGIDFKGVANFLISKKLCFENILQVSGTSKFMRIKDDFDYISRVKFRVIDRCGQQNCKFKSKQISNKLSAKL